jgi:hypothetical protein
MSSKEKKDMLVDAPMPVWPRAVALDELEDKKS